MLSINTDVNSIKIRNYMSAVTNNLNSCTKKLSTGKKLNTASDDAAGLYLSEGINARIRSYNIGIQAAQTGVAILNIAESAINQITQNVLRARDISVQASSDYYTQDARNAMQDEVDELLDQIQMEKDGCNFNGKQLLAAGTSNQITENPAGGGISAFQQLTIDDFTNIVTTTLEEISEIWTEQEFNDNTYGMSSLTYEQYVAKCNELLDVSIQKGEKDGQTYYFIENADQLKSAIAGGFYDDYWIFLSVHSSANFVFLSDIDLNGVEWERYNNYSEIDGNGHKISNYHSDTGGSALIYHNSGTIKNLSMENCFASGDGSAILCCDNSEGSSITDCYVTDSTVSGTGSAILCRDNYYGSSISNCYVTDSTVSGTGSAILCRYNNGGSISDCYVTDSTVSGTYSAILCRYNDYANIINTYALNITADEGMKYIWDIYGEGTVANNYQNHNENDPDATYKATEWFASEDAVSTLGNAFELVEGKDHPTLKSNPEPVPPTPPEPSGEKMRIQVGEDASASSFIEIDLGFDLGTLSIDLSTTEGAVKAIEDIDKLLTVLNNKQSEIGAVFNRLESVAMSNTMGVENMSAGLSTIVDADIAKLNSEYVKNQILQNASSALMVQASNLNREVVLGLLRNL